MSEQREAVAPQETKSIEAIYRAIGARVEQMRGFLGLTQDELAKRIGLTRVSIANIELGRQRILPHTIEAIAKGIGTTPKHLLKGIWW